MGLNFFKKKPEFQPYDPTPTHTEAQERYKRQIAEVERRLTAGPNTNTTAKDQTKPISIKEIQPEVRAVETAQDSPAQAQPIEALPTKSEDKAYNHTKDTGTIRFHNPFIAKLKELKAQDQTFEGYLKERLGV